MASSAVDFARSNQQRFLNELKDLLRIPSVSTLEEHKPDMQKAAEFVASELRRIGMENVEVIPTKGHPLIYADWLHAAGKPTVLCYAHYDVQPPDPLDEWITPPFEPTERNNNIYARGAVDDKGQLWMEVKALESLMKARRRQTAHQREESVRRRRRSRRRVDRGLCPQAESEAEGRLRAGLRHGTVCARIFPRCASACAAWSTPKSKPYGAKTDLHSGMYGGAAPNPFFALIEIISKLKDSKGKVLIPGFYPR